MCKLSFFCDRQIKRHFSIAIFTFLIAITGCTQKETVQVILLAGQSNMAGRGVYADLSESDKMEIEKVSQRVLVSSQGNKALPLGYAKAEKHINEFGPELFIGLSLAKAYPDQEFLLIKRAVGGTSLHGAWSPDWTTEKALASERGESRQKMKLYDEHINYIHQNLDSLKNAGKAYNIIGIAWMQGEKDSRLKLSATHYEENLKRLIQAYRTDFKSPTLPLICGQINNPVRGAKDYQNGPSDVRVAIKNVSESDKNVVMIATSTDPAWNDFPKHNDNVHYNAEGQKRLGLAMGKALMKLTK